MSWLSEDPWPLATTLAVVAVGFLIALRVTQQGKYLIAALVALALALVVVVVERVWVTERERVEAVVHAIGAATERSDADAVLEHMTPDVVISQGDEVIGGRGLGRIVPGLGEGATNPARAMIRGTIRTARFDFLRITNMKVTAGRLTGRGQANFRVYAAGSFTSFNFATPTTGTDWSLGFRKVGDRWMVESITATRMPNNYRIPTVSEPNR